MKFSTTNLHRLAVLAAVLAAPASNVMAQQFAPYGYSAQPTQPGYSQPQPQSYAPQYTAMAYQPNGVNLPSSNLESVPPGPMQQAPQPTTQSAPTQPGYQMPGDQEDSQMGTGGYESYSAGCATGNCGMGNYGNNYNTFSGGCGQCTSGGDVCYGSCGACAPCCPRRHWFGGVYGLLMSRVICGNQPLAFTSTTPGPGAYPTDQEIAMTTGDLGDNLMGGAEFRFGATCGSYGGCGGYGGCNTGGCASGCGGCGNGCGPIAWEAAYWGLAQSTNTATVTDDMGDGMRTYGMMNFQGLVYNGRPVNVFFDYGPPATDNTNPYDVEVRQLTARSQFSAQNIELNLLRLPLLGGGYMGCGTCSTCGPYGGGYGGGPCGTFCGPRCQVTTLVGARYMRFDDDFYLRSDYENMSTSAVSYLAYNSQATNQLVGVQLGANGAYYMGCSGRFALQCATNAGIFNNFMNVKQNMDTPVGSGPVTVNPTGENFYSNSDSNQVAFLGELRVGASYQCSCHCRLYAGYRVLGVTGVALALDQKPNTFNTLNQIGYINCNGSVFLHGLQSGIQFCY